MRPALTIARRIGLAFVALLLLAAPGFADDAADKAELETLFTELRAAPDAQAAHLIDQHIWQIWTSPSDPDIALRMREVIAARSYGDVMDAIDLLTGVVTDYPDYAEGWNQRATLYYMINDFEHSLADIDKVLQFEPRHFGALSGRVLIYLAQGKRALALRDMERALEIHPFLTERQLFPELKQDMVRI